ncbi:MAG: hypothetical protein CL916_12165, partial [Deltaproteobacteria bacterium]|nr:hypothetical protein [Deltaproteobacteria bacterium]
VLIGVSDERDQSADYATNVNYWQDYISLFQDVKTNPEDVIIHAIGGDNPVGCGGNEAYTGMYEATMATGGIFLSICALDWGEHLQTIVDSFVNTGVFDLTDTPVPESIVLQVDGVTITEGWEYDETENAIIFEEASIPLGGSTIDITYAVAGTCE